VTPPTPLKKARPPSPIKSHPAIPYISSEVLSAISTLEGLSVIVVLHIDLGVKKWYVYWMNEPQRPVMVTRVE
jgi:hypothetical protein